MNEENRDMQRFWDREKDCQRRGDADETPVSIEGVYCSEERPKAILVYIPGRQFPVWIPQSQVHDDSEVYRAGDRGRLVISAFIAREKGLVK